MSYENAVPKPLKFLISDGKMIDDAGNVISESDTLKDLYTKWNPEVKKYLLSDGSVVDENNNLIIKNDYWKKVYEQADPKIAKYLHADGIVDENPGSGEINLEERDVLITENSEIEVTPSQEYDGLSKVTVIVNVPSGSDVPTEWYLWEIGSQSGRYSYLPFDTAPETLTEDTYELCLGDTLSSDIEITTFEHVDYEYENDETFYYGGVMYYRADNVSIGG